MTTFVLPNNFGGEEGYEVVTFYKDKGSRDLMYKKLKGNCKKIAIADDDEKKLYKLAWTEI